MRHGALVKIDFSLLLKLLDFEGGIIHRVYTPDDCLQAGYCFVVLEHPDLPATPDREQLQVSTPVYTVHYAEGGGILKIERNRPIELANSANLGG